VDELELHPVRILEENRIIIARILRIIRRRIEHLDAMLQQQRVEPVDVLTAVGAPGKVVEPGSIAPMA